MITFETKIWEGDWQKVLRPECIGVNFKRCYAPTMMRVVMINNVVHPEAILKKCQDAFRDGLTDSYIKVDNFANVVLEHFGLKKADFGDGYRYSIAELVSAYVCNTPYLLHFSGDSMVADETPEDWLETGVKVLESRPDVAVFNLPWNRKHDEVAQEASDEDDDYYYGYGFSDQMYLVRTADFVKPIYSHTHEDTFRHHHGEIFEKRVDAWMRTTKRLRATLKVGSYIHPTYGD